MAGRTAIVCTLVAWVAIAHADKRRVAVIDLSGDDKAQELAKRIGDELTNHPELQIIFDQTVIGDLMGPYTEESATDFAEAQQMKRLIDDQLGQFDLTNVGQRATRGEEALHKIAPNATVLSLYADFAFAQGWARVAEKKFDEANTLFELTHRLAPDRVVDPNTTPNDVTTAFEAAKTSLKTKPQGTLMVKGSGHAWIDGRDMGPPGPYEIQAGAHVVWLTGTERETRGVQVYVPPGKVGLASIEDSAAPRRLKIRRARALLRTAPDATARASAMLAIAKLLDVHDAVLLTVSNGQIIVQTWRDKESYGFSSLKEVKNEKAIDLLEPLAPRPKQIAGDDGNDRKIIVPPPTPWYRKRSYQVTIGSALLVVAAIVVASSFEGHVPLDTDPKAR